MTVEYHSKYAVFRFTRGKGGHAEMHYKLSSTHPWEPQEGDGHQVITVS